MLKNTTDCVPFEEGLDNAEEEEPPKTLLEVSDTETNRLKSYLIFQLENDLELQQVLVMVNDETMLRSQMHRDKMVKEKKKKKKSKKNKKQHSDSSDSESEEKKKEKLKRVRCDLQVGPRFSCSWSPQILTEL